MRNLQFGILLVASSLVSILLIKQVFLSRALYHEQQQIIDSREAISQGGGFESLWKQLAIHIYQASRQDPALADVLKIEKIEIRAAPAAGAGSASGTSPSAPPASSKTPAASPPPATP